MKKSNGMIEVFRTNVTSLKDSQEIVIAIRRTHPYYRVNFDLQDADRILRIVSPINCIDMDSIVHIVREFGYRAEVLVDELISSPGDFLSDPV